MSGIIPSWLLKAKVSTPAPGAGHVPRVALLKRLGAALEGRFALLQAPAGFGKTTALADLSRKKREDGLVVAWISLDEHDVPTVLGAYLACALERGGLDLSGLNGDDGWPSSPVAYQIGLLARAVELHEAPCLLVLDEVDRLPRESVELVRRLVEHGPGNLHFALAFRSDPGLDLSMQVLDGAGVVVGAGELRFSRSEMEQFFRGALSRRQLAAAEEQTSGWPAALTVYRIQQGAGEEAPGAPAARLSADFVRSRLLGGLSAADRTFVCELAFFDWIDAELVDEVRGSGDASARIASLSALDGLLAPISSDGSVTRMHPLVRDPCVDMLATEDPARKRFLHAGIARALARRGQLVAAWGQARAAGDAALTAELVERAGVFEIWLRQGVPSLVSANEFLTPEVTASHPRLALLRSVVLRMALKMDEAVALYESAAQATEDFTRDRTGGDADALAVDRVFARVVLAGGSHLEVRRELDKLLPAGGLVPAAGGGRFRLGARHMVLCGSSFERARFDECRRHASLARGHFGEERRYGNLILDVYEGMAAMAEGRAGEAAACYGRARRAARRHFASDPCLAVCVDALVIELDLERNREKAVERRTLKALAALRAIWTDIDAAAFAVTAELTFEQHGADTVTTLLRETLAEVGVMRSETLSRFVSGLLVFYLVEAGRPDEAARAWREHALPEDLAALVDLDRQSWRTVESMACARVRLLAAQGDFAAAEEAAAALCATAAEHGLVRLRMRGLALSMAAAEQAGEADRALARLAEFLRLMREADYVRPLVRCRDVSGGLLGRLLRTEPDAEVRSAAESALERLDRDRPDAKFFSPRELQVLAEVSEGRLNKEIAVRLGVSVPAVRFHLGNIYRKTGVNRREDAVRAAQSLGVLN